MLLSRVPKPGAGAGSREPVAGARAGQDWTGSTTLTTLYPPYLSQILPASAAAVRQLTLAFHSLSYLVDNHS